jgi:hypothetical protein
VVLRGKEEGGKLCSATATDACRIPSQQHGSGTHLVTVAGDDVRRVGGARCLDGLAAEAGDGAAGAQHVGRGGPSYGHRAPGAVAAVVPCLPRPAAASQPWVHRRHVCTTSRSLELEGCRPGRRRLCLDGVSLEERVVKTVLLLTLHAVDDVAVLALHHVCNIDPVGFVACRRRRCKQNNKKEEGPVWSAGQAC